MCLKRFHRVWFILGVVPLFFLSCSKKGDFIDEAKVGSGVHYYPLILSNALRDTVTHKYLKQTDTTFSPGQTIVFELDYVSQSPIASLELWAGKSPNNLKKTIDIPFHDSFLSLTKFADTVLFSYQLPADIDTKSISKWYLQPRVITQVGLVKSMNAVLRIK